MITPKSRKAGGGVSLPNDAAAAAPVFAAPVSSQVSTPSTSRVDRIIAPPRESSISTPGPVPRQPW